MGAKKKHARMLLAPEVARRSFSEAESPVPQLEGGTEERHLGDGETQAKAPLPERPCHSRH